METRALETQLGAGFRSPEVAAAQRAEVLRRLGNVVAVQTEDDPTRVLAVDVHVEEHLGGDGGVPGGGQVALQQELPAHHRVVALEDQKHVVILFFPVRPVEVHRAGQVALQNGPAQAVHLHAEPIGEDLDVQVAAGRALGQGHGDPHVRRAGDGFPRHVSRELGARSKQRGGRDDAAAARDAPRERGAPRVREEGASNGRDGRHLRRGALTRARV